MYKYCISFHCLVMFQWMDIPLYLFIKLMDVWMVYNFCESQIKMLWTFMWQSYGPDVLQHLQPTPDLLLMLLAVNTFPCLFSNFSEQIL